MKQEATEQSWLVNWFRCKYPGVIIYAIPNGGSRNLIEAKNLKAQGVLAGMPDLAICAIRCGFGGMFLEFKPTPLKSKSKARLSPHQLAMLQTLKEAGYYAVAAWGIMDAKLLINNYMEGKTCQEN